MIGNIASRIGQAASHMAASTVVQKGLGASALGLFIVGGAKFSSDQVKNIQSCFEENKYEATSEDVSLPNEVVSVSVNDPTPSLSSKPEETQSVVLSAEEREPNNDVEKHLPAIEPNLPSDDWAAFLNWNDVAKIASVAILVIGAVGAAIAYVMQSRK